MYNINYILHFLWILSLLHVVNSSSTTFSNLATELLPNGVELTQGTDVCPRPLYISQSPRV